MNPIKKLLFLSAPLFTLAGCSSTTGLAAEYYDGVKIERDEAAIEAFIANREIIGAEKETYFDEMLFEFLAQPALPFPKRVEHPLGLTGYPNDVGTTLVPEGRYTIVFEGYGPPDSFMVTDESGKILYQQLMNQTAHTFELDLFAGQVIKGTTPDPIASIVLYPERTTPFFLPSSSEGEQNGVHFSNGVFHVGTHLPAGDYEVFIPSGFLQQIPHLYLVTANEETKLYELLGDPYAATEIKIDLTLKDGDVFLIENSPGLSFIPTKSP